MAPSSPTIASRRRSIESLEEESELDLLAGLWQEAPFARLPPDAPLEFRELVADVHDPRRVYVIHHASRRHDFQIMVEKYIYQLRYGCGSQTCTVSTCFTCRKRLAGKAPLRRYSPLSARTLAVYLASQDNPEKGLCPTLRIPKDAPQAAAKNLLFGTLPRETPLGPKRSNSHGSAKSPKGSSKPRCEDDPRSTPRRPRSVSQSADEGISKENQEEDSKERREEKANGEPDYYHTLRDRPVNKDHRSFAANLFGTVVFRMLEWLTPQGMAAISKGIDESKPLSPASPDSEISPPRSPTRNVSGVERRAVSTPSPLRNGAPTEKLAPPETLHPSPQDPTKARRRPENAFRSPQSWKPRRRASLEPPSPSKTDEPRSPTKSPRPDGSLPEKLKRALGSPTTVTRGIPEIPAQPAFFSHVPSQIAAPEDDISDRSDPLEVMASPSNGLGLTIPKLERRTKAQSEPISSPLAVRAAEAECPAPQSLQRLNADIVDFICDVFDKDNTGEHPLSEMLQTESALPTPTRGKTPLRRKRKTRDTICRRQWKMFNEQTLFSVLSDPRSLISSFSADGDLFDSHTLWYCMFRLTKVAPTLVFHSLWLAADSLFVAPKALQEGNGNTSKLFRRNRSALSDFEAGALMSICLHALAGSVPICPDKQSLRALAWTRSSGLTLSTFPDVLDQPASVREGFDDAFSNELAVRLARRLCTALTARRRFAEILEAERLSESQDDIEVSIDVLDPFFNQIDILGLEATPALEFGNEPMLHHEGRMQLLMLDWARTVIFKDWDGQPEFATSGALGGALTIIDSMYEQRELLSLSERDFQMGYLSEHLECMNVAVSWLGFTSTNYRKHLLDYPYLFNSNTLVSFFRAINFSRMSRTFEESSSLESRMDAIIKRGSLITNPHHKMVLQDMLRTASRRYLILEVSRKNVLRDAFDQLWRREERELLRPLKVHFGEDSGEMGFDSGGVQQEFFRMAISEFLDPHHGAFTVDDRTRMAWFTPGSVVELWKFELLGLLVSLAVFNGLTLPVTFPKALYHKLLNWPVTELHHIEDGWPDLASGLTQLQEWDEKDGAVEDIFARTYEFSVLSYGTHVTRDMSTADTTWPQVGKTAPQSSDQEAPLVTKDNRDEYINDYIRYLTDVSVRPQFTAFERGFRTVLDAKSLTLLNPSILQSLVEGVQTFEISELRRHTRYVGWDATHSTIRDFWSIVKRYDESMKRRLLEFVTASDRLPVGGVSNLQFVVQKNGEEEGTGGHLPTAYTCYGTLLLPEYRDKEVLRERLAMALENAQGFGFA